MEGAVVRRRSRRRYSFASLAFFISAAAGYIAFLRPARGLEAAEQLRRPMALAAPALDAYGRSGGVRMRFALPGNRVEFPIEVHGDPASLRYVWLPISHGEPSQPRSLVDSMVAPKTPGIYHLAILTDSGQRVIDDLPLAVLVPFDRKLGSSINGYRIGWYRGERARRPFERSPAGFVEIRQEDLDIKVTEHLRLADFVTHDAQTTWPRYAALDPRLLDKVELVVGEIASWQGPRDRIALDVNVHSGFRTPQYNRTVTNSAGDSRHQYGDAADIAIDANKDGVVNQADARLVALAAEIVERQNPDLVGGVGVYSRGRSSYVHIDARGERRRWHG